MNRKEEEYQDGTSNLTEPELMQLALQRKKTIGPKQWMMKSTKEIEFIAMRAELTAMKKKLTQNGKIRGVNKPKSKETRPPRKNEGKWAWKGVDPKEGEPHAKVVDKKQYVYCPRHDETKWVLKIGRNGLEHTLNCCLLYTSPSPRDLSTSRMPSSA